MAIGGGGGGRGASDVRAGGAFWELYAKDGVSAVIDKLQRKVQNFAGFMRRIGGTLMGAGGVLGAGPLGFLLGGISRAGDIANLSRQFQIPIDQMARLKFAADAAGASVEDVIKNPGLFADLLRDAPGLNSADAARAVQIQKEWRLANVALQNSMLSLLDVLAPVVKFFSEFIQRNAGGIVIVAGFAAGIFALGVAFTTAGTVIAGATALISALLTPMGLITAAAITLAVVFREELARAFAGTGQVFGQVWKGIMDAAKGGDMQLAFEVLSEGIRTIWYRLLIDMGKAFSDFIERNRDRLIAIGALMGGVRGASIGGRFGPWGALFGGLGGAAAGGFGADKLADLVQGFGSTGLEGSLAASQARLSLLTARAAAAAGASAPQLQQLMRAAEMVRGGFGSDRAGQVFGYGEKAGLRMLEDIKDGKGGLPDAIGAAVAASLVVR